MPYEYDLGQAKAPSQSWTQGLAEGVGNALAIIRQKKKDQQDQAYRAQELGIQKSDLSLRQDEFQAGLVERGFTPASDPGHPQPPAPDTMDDAIRMTPSTINTGPTIPVTAGAAQEAPGAGSSLASTISDIRAFRKTNEQGETVDQYGIPTDEPSVSPQGDHLGAATSSGTLPDTRTGEAPTASRVRIAGQSYDYRNPTIAAESFRAGIEDARARRQRAEADGDRLRNIHDLQGTGLSAPQAAIIADRQATYRDVVPEKVSPDQIAENTRAENQRFQDAMAEERLRISGQKQLHALTQKDTETAALDKLNDDAANDLKQATTEYQKLRSDLDPRMAATDPGHAAWVQEVASAQDRLTKAQQRSEFYKSRVDARTAEVTHSPLPANLGPKKTPSAEQASRAAGDDEFRKYLESQGYDMSASSQQPRPLWNLFGTGGH